MSDQTTGVICLFGEPEFPIVENQFHDELSIEQLLEFGITGHAIDLLERWKSQTRLLGSEYDLSVSLGVSAGTAIARDLGFRTRVSLVMRIPSDGDWVRLDMHDPSVD